MRYKPLGRTGVQVSQLCFGTMSFGGDAEHVALSSILPAVISRAAVPAFRVVER